MKSVLGIAFRVLFLLFVSQAVFAEDRCRNVLPEGSPNALPNIYLAASSIERGCKKPHPEYAAELRRLIERRAKRICELQECPTEQIEFETQELQQLGEIMVLLPGDDHFEERLVKMKKPWVFGNMGSRRLGEAMWYGGQILTLSNLVTTAALPPLAPLTLTLSGVGGLVSFSSRYVMTHHREVTPEHALQRIRRGKEVSRIHSYFGNRVPHLVFTSVSCQEGLVDLEDLL